MATKKKSDEKVTYLLMLRDGSRKKITVPASYKLTFGALVPGSKDGSVNSSGATALRLYDGTNQKAVFTGVESFRDMNIGIEEEVTRSQAETFYKDGEDGQRKAVVVEGTMKEWINPDIPRPVSENFDIRRLPGARHVLNESGAVVEDDRQGRIQKGRAR